VPAGDHVARASGDRVTERHILNLGAGVQSTTLYLLLTLSMILRGVVPARSEWAERMLRTLDAAQKGFIGSFAVDLFCAIFADTGEEPGAEARRRGLPDTPGSVYAHLDWLMSLNGPSIWIRSKGRLGDDLAQGVNSTGQRFASIPAFTIGTEDETEGRLRRQCSKEYKIEVINASIKREVLGLKPRQRVPHGHGITCHYGISLDESGRAASIWEAHNIGRWVEDRKTARRRLTRTPFPHSSC